MLARSRRDAADDARDEQFRCFVERRRAALVRSATFLAAGDRFAAEDLVQTALIRIYLAWPRVRLESVDAYASRALTNAFIDTRRRAAVRPEQLEAALPDVAEESFDLGAAEPAVSGPALFAALAELPPRMRAAVVLRHQQGLSVAEAAVALRCSEGNVKSQTARGLARLRELLGLDLSADGAAADSTTPGTDRLRDDTVVFSPKGSS